MSFGIEKIALSPGSASTPLKPNLWWRQCLCEQVFFALRDSRITCYAADIELRCWTLPSGCSCTEHNLPLLERKHSLTTWFAAGPLAHLCHLQMSVIFLFFQKLYETAVCYESNALKQFLPETHLNINDDEPKSKEQTVLRARPLWETRDCPSNLQPALNPEPHEGSKNKTTCSNDLSPPRKSALCETTSTFSRHSRR